MEHGAGGHDDGQSQECHDDGRRHEADAKTLKKQYGKIDIDKIERLNDEMADLMEVGNEIQESLGRGYDVPEDVDEAELDAELEALGEEVEFEREMGAGVGESMPSFMVDEVPSFVDEPPVKESQMKEAAG